MLDKEQGIKRFSTFRVFLLAIVVILLYSCQTVQTPTRISEPKVALVLGGGSAKGFATAPINS